MTIDSTVVADTLTTTFPAVLEASLGKENCQSREGICRCQSRSGYSRSGDSHICRKGLCGVLIARSCRFSRVNEGQSLSLHILEGIAALSHVSGSPRASEPNYCRSRRQEIRSRSTPARIHSKLGSLLRNQSGASKYLLPRISPPYGQGPRNSKRATEGIPSTCARFDRGRVQGWSNANRFRYSNSYLLFVDRSKWNSHFSAGSTWGKGSTDGRRDIRSSLLSNPDSRCAKGKIDLANSAQVGFAKLRTSNQLTGVNL